MYGRFGVKVGGWDSALFKLSGIQDKNPLRDLDRLHKFYYNSNHYMGDDNNMFRPSFINMPPFSFLYLMAHTGTDMHESCTVSMHKLMLR